MWEIGLSLGLVGVAFILALLSKSLDERHAPMKLFFFILTLMFLLVIVYVASLLCAYVGETTLENTLRTAYKAMMFVFITSTSYFVIYFIYAVLTALKLKKEQNDEL